MTRSRRCSIRPASRASPTSRSKNRARARRWISRISSSGPTPLSSTIWAPTRSRPRIATCSAVSPTSNCRLRSWAADRWTSWACRARSSRWLATSCATSGRGSTAPIARRPTSRRARTSTICARASIRACIRAPYVPCSSRTASVARSNARSARRSARHGHRQRHARLVLRPGRRARRRGRARARDRRGGRRAGRRRRPIVCGMEPAHRGRRRTRARRSGGRGDSRRRHRSDDFDRHVQGRASPMRRWRPARTSSTIAAGSPIPIWPAVVAQTRRRRWS